jgi:hypothetical protein
MQLDSHPKVNDFAQRKSPTGENPHAGSTGRMFIARGASPWTLCQNNSKPQQGDSKVARRLLPVCALLLLVAGCQQRRTTVDGTVTIDGKPISIASDARGNVVFHPVGGQGTMLTGLLDSSGHYRLATGSSSNVTPGRYRVAVSIVELLPKSEQSAQAAQRITPAKYASPNESGFEADVVPGENQLNFDLLSAEEEKPAEVDAVAATPDASDLPAASNETESR